LRTTHGQARRIAHFQNEVIQLTLAQAEMTPSCRSSTRRARQAEPISSWR